MRITKKVFLDLLIYMCGFGLIIGIIFPLFSVGIGIPTEYAFTYLFIISSILAGITLGLVNYLLAKLVVGRRLLVLSNKMKEVYERIISDSKEEDLDECLNNCMLPIDSDDEIGESSKSFNNLIKSFLYSQQSEESIRKFTEIFTDELDINKLSDKALAHIIEYTQSKAGMFIIDQGGYLEVTSSHLIKDPNSVIKLDIVKDAFETGKRTDFEFKYQIKVETGLLDFFPKAILLEPISYKGEVLGVLLLASTRSYNPSVFKDLGVYTKGLSLGLHNAIIHEKLQKLAVLDPLTKVYNRRFGMQRLSEEYGRSIRTDNPFGIMMLDIDHFKNVNDTYGHLVGDYVLVNFAKIIKSSLREGDLLIRYGGEEFIVILPGANAKGTLEVAEKIRRTIQENVMKHNDQEIKITVSIGISSYPENEITSIDDLIEIADKGLYHAKDTGRNRVVYNKS
ncbi:MAG: sensor domain-containing diguanylate cyclase [Candidatus Izemoplasma sp.]